MFATSCKRALALALACALATVGPACANRTKYVALPAPIELNTIGPGDTFDLEIVGEEKLPKSYTVAPDGTVDIPYINRLKVEGLQQQDIAELVKAKLIELRIRTDDPTVIVSIREFKSKRVEVLGEVNKPGSLPLETKMTLLRALSLAGGFTAQANRDQVTIRRRVSKDRVVKAVVPVNDIIDNKIADPLLQAGDTVNVPRGVF